MSQPVAAAPAKSEWQPWREREAELRQLDAQLNTLGDRQKGFEAAMRTRKSWPEQDARLRQLDAQINTLRDKQRSIEVALRVKRATLLAEMGRSLEARADHLKVVELDPSHRLNLIGLGQLLETNGQHKAAQLVYSEAVKYYPEDIISRVNLGAALLKGDDPIGARTHYEAALRIAPDFLQAHGGMYYTLARLGETEAAEAHRLKCFGRQNIFPIPYRGSSQPVSVLLLVSSRGGNAPIERLLDGQLFQTYVVVMDFHDPKTPLPAHDLVINGIGDCEVAPEELAAAESLLALTTAPVLNAPESVQATSRCDIAQRLSGVPGVVTPRTMTLSRELLAASDAQTILIRYGFDFPILLRTPGFHGGEHFLRVKSPDDLRAALGQLPGRELTVIQYLDARGADGKTRKYRVMMIDGELYPLHAAISSNWKIHYFNAEMADCADHRAEDAEFLANMSGVLGPRAMSALREIQKTLGLDYGGIDFGLNQKGEVLLFEANATMAVVPPDADQRWDYRRPAIGQIHGAVSKMLMDRANAFRIKANRTWQ
jgi:tetratricopeptide (TPR) repeat protein